LNGSESTHEKTFREEQLSSGKRGGGSLLSASKREKRESAKREEKKGVWIQEEKKDFPWDWVETQRSAHPKDEKALNHKRKSEKGKKGWSNRIGGQGRS